MPEEFIIEGMTDDGAPVTVSEDLTVTKGDAPPAIDAPEQPAPAEEQPADGAEAVEDEPSAGEPAPAAADKPADEADPEKPADAEEKPAEGDEEKPADEEKPEEEKPEEEKPAEEEPAEPSEAEAFVEAVGGLEVVKAFQPFIEAVHDPDAPVSEKITALAQALPETQMKEMSNEFFWQSVEDERVRDILLNDDEALEVFAQKKFGVPFGFLQTLVEENKSAYDEDFIASYARETPAGDAAPAASDETTAPAAEAKQPAEKKEDPKPEELAFHPDFKSILDDLSEQVDEVVAAAGLDEAQLKEFAGRWPDLFMGDAAAAELFSKVRKLAEGGSGKLARNHFTTLAKHARRVAAANLPEKKPAAPPAAAEKAAKAKAVGKESPGATSAPDAVGQPAPFADGQLPDLNSPEFERLWKERMSGGQDE